MDENQNTYPEDLTGLSPEDLTTANERAVAEAAELGAIDPAEMTDAQVDRLEFLANFMDSVIAENQGREAAAADRVARRDAALARLAGPTDEGGDDENPEGDDVPAEETPAEEAPAEDPAPVEGDDAAAPTAIAASGARPAPMSTVRRMRQPANPAPVQTDTHEGMAMAITASADIRDGSTVVAQGENLGSIAGAAPAFLARLKSFPQTGKGSYDRKPVAQITRDFTRDGDYLHIENPDFGHDAQALLKAAASEKRLPGGSLIASKMAQQSALVASGAPGAVTAAGGWCAPSENLYGMCADETLDGILDLPTMGVGRGGINYTPGPDFQDIYTDAGFIQTEAQAIAGDTKACTEVDCPDFTEVRLDAVGICVKSPLLTRAAYPELVERFLEGTVVANQHKINARILTAMATALGTAWAPTLTGTPVAWAALTAVEWVIETQRQAYRLSESESLEVIAPRWLRVQLRADIANRMGIGKESVSNADINQHFADRGAAVQFVLGWQEIASPTGTSFITIPATVQIMVYKAGTFVKGTADVISLDAIYDAAELVTNMFTAAFVEDGVLLAKMCHGGKRVTVPTGASGMLGSAQLDDPWGGAQAESVGA